MSELNPNEEIIEELSESIAGKLTSRLLKRVSSNPNHTLFATENDYELPNLKDFLKATISKELSDSLLRVDKEFYEFEEWKKEQERKPKLN